MPQDYPQAAVPPPAHRAAAESGGRLLDRRGVGMSDFWHKMGCCVVAKPPPKKKRRKIDRSMIGEPTNFIHLTHIGSGEMAEGLQPVRQDLPVCLSVCLLRPEAFETSRPLSLSDLLIAYEASP
ncbi:CDC42 small effector protein 1 [Morone saxatilis]|uniref:CDC42 small effector protein 1 n=1 Tax=Morone saxatilis TaxID=34816 RepID=UPI0015E1CBA3|nr:CDC42 small effector protein 1 [Morone saxatilis]